MYEEDTALSRPRLQLQPALREFTQVDDAYEQAEAARLRAIVEPYGASVYAVENVLHTVRRVVIDGIEWEIGPMDMTLVYELPRSVFARLHQIEEQGIQFGAWVWGDEKLDRPKFRVDMSLREPGDMPAPRFIEAIQATERRPDPILFGIVLTRPGRGVWVKLGAWFK